MEEKSLRKRLDETFSRYNYVGIKNPGKEKFEWTVALEQNEILNMSPADSMSEDQMARKGGGSFLPGDGATKERTRLVSYVLAPGEKKMVPGEAAYVLIPRLIHTCIREKYGSDKAGLSKLSVPTYQDEFLNQILVGPIVRNVGDVLNEFSSKIDSKIQDGFTGVEAEEQTDVKKPGRPRAAQS